MGRIVLDLTHGVNYMPSLALRVVEEAAALSSLVRSLAGSGVGGVEVLVYNSDPVMPSWELRRRLARRCDDPCRPAEEGARPPEAAVNLVLKRRYAALDLLSSIESLGAAAKDVVGHAAPECAVSGEARRELGEALREAKRVLKMLRYGLLPELLHYAAARGEGLAARLGGAVGRAYELWLEGVEVSTGAGGVRLAVRRCRRFEEGFRALLYAYHVVAHLLALVGRHGCDGGVCVDAVKELRDALSGSAIVKSLQDVELSKLRARSGGLAGGWRTLAEVYGVEPRPCDVGRFRRDLLAHGGWHTDVVEVRRTADGRVAYRVREDFECQGKSLWEVVDGLSG